MNSVAKVRDIMFNLKCGDVKFRMLGMFNPGTGLIYVPESRINSMLKRRGLKLENVHPHDNFAMVRVICLDGMNRDWN